MAFSIRENAIMETGELVFVVIVAAAFIMFGLTLAVLSSR